MKTQKITEGNIKLLVPEGEELTKKMSTFYNPEMKFDRDLSEAIISVLKPKKVIDTMCASGVRGLRYKSILPDSEVVLNDLNPTAVKLAEKNAKENVLSVRTENTGLLKILHSEFFDFIDIDPFGSPIYFLDAASKSIRNNGVVAITATDTAALCGTSPNASLRKYGVKSMRCDFSKELGLRILISAAMRYFSKEELAYHPIFSYSRRHYFRIFGQVARGAQKADKLLESFSHLSYCRKCGYRDYGIQENCRRCSSKMAIVEPVYIGDFSSKSFCEQVLESQKAQDKTEKTPSPKINEKHKQFIGTVKSEQGFPPYCDVHRIAELNGRQIPPTEELLKKLGGVRTHFLGTGIKTKKSFGDLVNALR
ncbi:MAG: methyltransferase [Candidatus Aenigmarchaeota archaeon]|nr:methyltransferase [Candidatus Aenigmarchaeota archaeon]